MALEQSAPTSLEPWEEQSLSSFAELSLDPAPAVMPAVWAPVQWFPQRRPPTTSPIMVKPLLDSEPVSPVMDGVEDASD